ncbi:hypothetical protein ABMA27_012660 [Loxostege sticticalis]|uniref:Uncharacterized protein n=1 Tax=Loxostege sticticalis TaxID=481309 RepID=A0ABR3GZR2_LOXSC
MDDTHNSRTSDAAAATRKRRSSILKSQRPPRTPFSELEFNVATPTDAAKSRRVSFSRRTGVAEFITNEATTTWKNFYEEQNKSLESSGNESGAHAPRPIGHIGKRFDQLFEDVEAIEFGSALDNHPNRNINTSINNANFIQQLASLECTDDDRKLSVPQQNFEMSAFTDNQSKLFGDDLAVPTMGEISGQIDVNFSLVQTIQEVKDDLDEIQKDLQRAQSNGGCSGPFVGRRSMSEYIEVDLNATHVSIKNDDDDMSITDTIHSPKVQDISKSNSSIKIDNKINFSKDWVTDKENIAIDPYITPKEATNFAINDDSDKILVFDGKRLTVHSDKEAEKILKGDSNDLKPTIPKEPKAHQRKTIVLDTNDGLPNFIEHSHTSNTGGFKPTLMYDGDDDLSNKNNLLKNQKSIQGNDTGNISITQAIPGNIILRENTKKDSDSSNTDDVYEDAEADVSMTDVLPSKIIGSQENIEPQRRRTILYENDTGDISITRAIPANIILNASKEMEKQKSGPEKRRTIIFDNEMENISITQAIPANILVNEQNKIELEKRRTIVYDDDMGDISMTQAIPANIILNEKKEATNLERRRTIVYDNDMGNISMTQAIPANIILNKMQEVNKPESDRRRTIVYDDDMGNISMTQAIPANIILNKMQEVNKPESERRRTIVYDDDMSNISMTQALPANIILNKMREVNKPEAERRRTIVYDDDMGDISMTQAIPANIILNENKEAANPERRRTIVYDDDMGNISMTQAIPANIILNKMQEVTKPESERRRTIVYDDDMGDISMTQAIPANIILNKMQEVNKPESERRRTIVYDDDMGNISMTQAIPANIILNKMQVANKPESGRRRTIVYDDDMGDISMTQAIPANIILNEHKEVNEPDIERRRTILYDNDMGNISMTQAIPTNIIAKNGDKVELQRRRTILYDNNTGNISMTQSIPPNILLNENRDVDKSKTILYEKIDADISMTQAIPTNLLIHDNSAHADRLKRQTVVFESEDGNVSVSLPSKSLNIGEESKPEKRKTLIYDRDTPGNVSMTQEIPANIIFNEHKEVNEPEIERRRTILYDNDMGNISMTHAIPTNIIAKEKKNGDKVEPQRRRTILYDNNTGNISMTQSIPNNILVNENRDVDKSKTILYEKIDADISMTQAIPTNLLIHDTSAHSDRFKRQSIVFESEDGNISVSLPSKLLNAQAIPANIITNEKSKVEDEKRSMVYDNLMGNVSNNQNVPAKEIFPSESGAKIYIVDSQTDQEDISNTTLSHEKCKSILRKDEANRSHISISNNIFTAGKHDGSKRDLAGKINIVSSKSDVEDISTSRAVSNSILLPNGKRKTIVFEDEISVTKTLPTNIFGAEKRDDSKKDLEEKINIVSSESDVGDVRAVHNNTLLPNEKRKTIVYEDEAGNISVTQTLPTNILGADKREVLDSRKTILYESNAPDTSVTQAVLVNVLIVNNASEKRQMITCDTEAANALADTSKVLEEGKDSQSGNLSDVQDAPVQKKETPPEGSAAAIDFKNSNVDNLSVKSQPTVLKADNKSSAEDNRDSSDGVIYIIRDTEDETQTDKPNESLTRKADVPRTQQSPLSLAHKADDAEASLDLPKKLEELKSIVTEKNRMYEKVVSSEFEIDTAQEKLQSDESFKISKGAKSFIDANDTNELLEMLSDLTEKSYVKLVVCKEPEKPVETIETNEPRRVSIAPKRLSVISREDLLNNISMAQAALQMSPDTEESMHDTSSDTPREDDLPTKNPVRMSNEVVKKLHFEDESASDASIKSEIRNSPLKKTSFGEDNMNENKPKVIPSYLKDVSDEIKALMNNLVKPSMDMANFHGPASHSALKKDPSKCSTQIQANLGTSSDAIIKSDLKGSPLKKTAFGEGSNMKENKVKVISRYSIGESDEIIALMNDLVKPNTEMANYHLPASHSALAKDLSTSSTLIQANLLTSSDGSVKLVLKDSPLKKTAFGKGSNMKQNRAQVTSSHSIDESDETGALISDLVKPNMDMANYHGPSPHSALKKDPSTCSTQIQDNLVPSSDVSIKSDLKGSPLKKTAFGEGSYIKENKAKVIPSYLNDVSDEIKAQMHDLVKPHMDMANYHGPVSYSALRKDPSTCSAQIQANLEPSSDASIKSDLKGSPLKKTAFGEGSYIKENKVKVIPSYLKDVSDDIKALMNDLVKPNMDMANYHSPAPHGALRKDPPSTCSTQIQANLITSSQIDLETELTSATDSGYTLEKESGYSLGTRETHSHEFPNRSSRDVSFRPKPKVVKLPSEERVVVFDPVHPLNNVLLVPFDLSDVHRYNPHESNETLCTDSQSDRSAKEAESTTQTAPEVDSEVESSTDVKNKKRSNTQVVGSVAVSMTQSAQEADSEGQSTKDVDSTVSSNTRIVGSVAVVHSVQPSGDSVPDKNDAHINTGKPSSVEASVSAIRVCALKEIKVNTIIAMKRNNELLDASSSLTLVDDALARSTFDINLDTAVSSVTNSDNSPVKVLYHNQEPGAIPSEKIESVSDSLDEIMLKMKGNKRNYSPTKSNYYSATSDGLDVTPKPAVKMQKMSNSPKYKAKLTAERDEDVSKVTDLDESSDDKTPPKERKRRPRKKSPKYKKPGTTVTIQQLLTQYDIHADIDQDALNKKIIEALSGTDSSTAPDTVSLSEFGSKSPDVVSSFTSSKNQNERETRSNTPENQSLSDKSRSSKMDWQPAMTDAASCGSLTECDSSVNVVAKIDMLPFMGSPECEWEASSGDTWSFRLLYARLRLSVRLAHTHHNATRTRVRADTRVRHVALDATHEAKKNAVAILCVNFASEAMRYFIGRGCSKAGDVPALLKRCAAVARVALRWGRAMQEARINLAYTLSNDGRLALKVANIPLRSVWEVTMRLELVAEADEVPWPRASDVRVARVVSDYSVPDDEVKRALAHLPRDWGHVPRTVWRIFRYLKNKTREGDLLGL